MLEIDRLISSGISAERAFDIVYYFLSNRDKEGLERYICEIERWKRQIPNDS